MSARNFPSPRTRRAAAFAAALAAAVGNAQPGYAADDAVQIACPELSTERAAELESRLRANLLTSEPAVRVRVTCQPAKTEVRVASTTDDVAIEVQAKSVDTFRDDVLHAVEEARLLLAQRQADTNAASAAAPSNEPLPVAPTEPAPSPPVAMAPPAPVPTPVAKPLTSRSWTELFGQLLGEAWGNPIALGGALGIARSTPVLWYGLRTAVLRSTAPSADFSATEWQAAAELGFQPAFGAGVRVTLGLGPAMLFVTPHGSRTPRTNKTATSALFFDAHVSRPIWFGHWALLPQLGVRLFTRERGVRTDAEERLNLRGFVPQLGVGVAYRID